MFKLGIYYSIAIIALNLNGYQTKSLNGDFSETPPNPLVVKILPLLDHITKQSKLNILDDLTQIAMQKNSDENLIALQNQQADIQKSLESQLETQTNLEKDQRSLMETLKNIIPEHFTERLAKMEEQQTSLQKALKKIPKDLQGRLQTMENNQKAVRTQQAALVDTLSKIYDKIFLTKFERIASRHFFIDSENKYTWEGAVDACRKMGGYLASIKDQEELNAMKARLDLDKLYWLGINDRATKNDYISVASGKKSPFLKWEGGEPNHAAREERCVQLINGVMYDEPCGKEKYLICQANFDF
ncbi:accessory gland protein Acp29AB-like [Drosophila takahashii]|uniref:accessory gland protein Acp29AB-like n=1 Tax=Drosophila takahashii TaxID=29030 RepID=UPI00389942F5